ncbi:thiopurine S-methyltransferase [Vibrio sp.]|nr:thiopurine S-methyltransferase [Vibrio sp.]
MEHEFWHNKWAKNQLGFHLTDVNPSLKRFWDRLEPQHDEAVFVPLCGKSEDLIWLATQHHKVQGVELSKIAVRSFFAENFYTPLVYPLSDQHDKYEFDELEIFTGDYFTAPLAPVDLIYDRAALIALPENMRKTYVERLKGLVKPGGRMLLITLEYPQGEMQGPPFSVSESEVHSLYDGYTITLIDTDENTSRPPKGQSATYFREKVYLIEGF